MDPYAQRDDASFGVQQSMMGQPQMFDYGNESPNPYSYYDGDVNGGMDDMDGGNDNGDPKRRRIARVRAFTPLQRF